MYTLVYKNGNQALYFDLKSLFITKEHGKMDEESLYIIDFSKAVKNTYCFSNLVHLFNMTIIVLSVD